MRVQVYSLANQVVGEKELSSTIFALKPNQAIIKRVVDWQLNKARRGTHKAKTRAEVSGTGKKPFKQKGGGRARQGTLRAPQMRGGGVAHGPQNRSHSTDLPKKLRKLGLYHALSFKMSTKELIIVDQLYADSHKTAQLVSLLRSFQNKDRISILMVCNSSDPKLHLAARNIPHVTLMPVIGINPYDILKFGTVILSAKAVDSIQANQNIG